MLVNKKLESDHNSLKMETGINASIYTGQQRVDVQQACYCIAVAINC